jgi:acetyl-CoA/propionyl-CoA carboxylase biotin carboxyl carrier protein
MLRKVLIANRGEIAVRIIRTLRRLGIASVAVYSDADAGARHVREAGEAVRIGPAAAAESYLSIDAIIAAARAAGADAIHPGYGFLAENPRLARACADAGLVFVGPPPAAIEAMGDKIAAKATVAAAGVPVVPGFTDQDQDHNQFIDVPNGPSFPLLVKPSAGGGGKGMVVVRSPSELPAALESARRTAQAAFGDGRLLIEKYVDAPRHIEIQVLADAHGTVVHLGERECSLQRRHQKIIEEAPSPFLSPARRSAMGSAAVETARSVGYVGAGTVEFIVNGGDADEFYFMEMNTRLQVEHPVTELVTGLDLVEWQIRVAAGEPLPFTSAPAFTGHAMEARIYAEDPARGFLPTGGTVLSLREPSGDGVRVDSGLSAGTEVTSAYDPMLAKIAAWGADRDEALRRLDAALADTVLLGVTTNTAFLRALLADPDVRAGRLDTSLAERVASSPGSPPGSPPGIPSDISEMSGGNWRGAPPDDVLAAAALGRLLPAGPVSDPWDIPDGWRIGGGAWTKVRFRTADGVAEVRVRSLAEVAVGDASPVAASAEIRGDELFLTYGGRATRLAYAPAGETTWLGRGGQAWALTAEPAVTARAGTAGLADGTVRSPMPGTVLAVPAAAGETVARGTPVVVVEAMKMEHTVAAPIDGVVTAVNVKAGQQVQMDELLAVIIRQETSDAELPTRSRTRGTAQDRRGVRPRGGRPGHRGPVRKGGVPLRHRRQDGRDGAVRPAGSGGIRRHGRGLPGVLPDPGGTGPGRLLGRGHRGGRRRPRHHATVPARHRGTEAAVAAQAVRGTGAGRVRADRVGRRLRRGRRDADPGPAGERGMGDRRVEVVHHQLGHGHHRLRRRRRHHGYPFEWQARDLHDHRAERHPRLHRRREVLQGRLVLFRHPRAVLRRLPGPVGEPAW